MNRQTKRSMQIIQRLQAEYPGADTMLKFASIFELVVAVVLSAQSTDEQVNRVTGDLFKYYNSPQAMAGAELSHLENLIRGVGIYKNKAKNIKHLAKIIHDNYHGEVPSSFDELLQLPGVGRKSANVIMAVGFKQPGLGVDTHVHRVANRLGLVNTRTPEQSEKGLKAIIPRDCWSEAHHLLIFHGRKICQARKPKCSDCVVEELCVKSFKP